MFKTQLAYENWRSKYRYGEETPVETFRRAAKALAEVELEENRAYWEDKFFRAMLRLSKDDVPEGIKNTTGGRITANIGTGYGHATLLNCFINGPVSGASIKYSRQTFDGKLGHDVVYQSDDNPDDLINIFLTLLEQAKTLASEGGYGINFDFIRPRGSLIKGTGIMHPGIVSYMKVWDSVSECIVKGTNDGYSDKLRNYLTEEDLKEAKSILKAMTRKGAMMGVLSVNHPDIEEFVRAKQTSGVLTKFNLSVLIDDKFMQAVEKDEMYDLTFKDKVYKRVKARDLYDLIMESTYNRAEPGVLFVDNMNKNNPLAYLGKATCTNPCCRKGTLTATENGLVPVENIKVGDRIQTSLGFEKVESIESHKSHDTYRVSFTDGSYLDVTEGHIFHSQNISVETRKKWDNQTRLSAMMDSPDSWFVRKSPYMFRTSNRLEEYTRDKGLLAGLFLGDGHIDANDKVCISVDKREDSKYIFDLCDRLGLSYWLDDSSKENSRKIVIGGRGDNKSVEVLKSLGLDTNLQASEKTFPYEWLNTNTNFLSGLMDGLLSSDGNVNLSARYPQIRYKSCSVELHTMVRHLMLFFGADYKLYPSAKKGEKRVILGREVTRKHDSFEGVIDNDSILNVFSGIEFISHPEKNKNLKEIIKKNSLGGVRWKTRVKSIEYIGKHDVYDLYTKESDDWNTCGIVSRGCGEVPGIASLTTTCLLGSINVTQYINIVDGRPVFDIEMYKEDIKTVTRMLDNVNDITYTPLPSYDWATKNIRQFGMGINGLGSALYMLGIPYNSEEAIKFTKNLCDLKENLTWQASSLLAKEKGVFPAYIKEKFENTEYFLSDRLWPETKEMLRKYGARNGKTTTNPPLGNSSIFCDIVSNGIEPVFLLEYERKTIVKNWPEGLDDTNIKSTLKHHKENDYEFWRGEFKGVEYYYEPHNRGLCEISIVRDYGYQWLLDNFPNKDHSKYLITTRDLNIDDHIKIQEAVQYHCNQSVSKCLVEGQTIETDLGPIPVEDFIEGNYSDEGFYPAKKYKVYNKLGKQVPVKLAYFGGEKPSVSIGIEAMPNIETSENHLFETTNGWTKAKDLKKGDFIFEQKYEYIHGKGKEPINFSVESLNLHYYKDIEIPKNMSENLAKFLGMIASDGDVCWPSVRLTEKNEEVGKMYQSLCLDLFKRNPRKQVDKRNGVVSWVINSVPLVRFVEFCLQGSKSHNKKIPIAVLRGSKSEKISFLSGLTLDGYYNTKKKCLCLYEGRSYELARNCFALCQQISTEECVWGKKWVKTHNYFIYSVSMYDHQIPAIEPHKRLEVDSREGFVWLKDSSMDTLSKPIAHTEYSLRGLKTRKSRIIRSKSAKKGSLEYRSVRRVKSVEEIGFKKVFDISVDSEDHTYLVNALVTHNTANLPNNFQFEDFKELYIKAWKKGLNGFTTYREGSMESVISDINKAEETYDIIEKDIKLPDVFNNGPTTIIKREGKKFYVHFSYLPEDSEMTFPVAMWIYSNNKYQEKDELKVCNKAARNLAKLALQSNVASDIVSSAVEKSKTDFPHNRLGRLISLCLRHHIPRADILISLIGIEGDNVSTLLTGVRKFLSSTLKDGTKLKGIKCEECGSESIVLEGGCKKCIDCGYSGCG